MPVETLGPGRRIVVWTCGCTKGCAGCANPELWDGASGRGVDVDVLTALLLEMSGRSGITRLTVTGGDPLEQPTELRDLLRKLRHRFTDILIYTGYTLAEAKEALGPAAFKELTVLADALIDGPYISALNDGACAMRGSTNQRLHLFNESLRKEYELAMMEPRRVQNAVFDGRSLSIGIHGGKAASEANRS